MLSPAFSRKASTFFMRRSLWSKLQPQYLDDQPLGFALLQENAKDWHQWAEVCMRMKRFPSLQRHAPTWRLLSTSPERIRSCRFGSSGCKKWIFTSVRFGGCRFRITVDPGLPNYLLREIVRTSQVSYKKRLKIKSFDSLIPKILFSQLKQNVFK